MLRLRDFACLAVLIAALVPCASASAQRCLPGDTTDDVAGNRFCGTDLRTGFGGAAGFGTNASCLSQNDDGSSPPIDIRPYFPMGLRFFDRTHNQIFVNTNGNITFSGRVRTFTPDPFPVANQPMIAPFWADVDIRTADDMCQESFGQTCTECGPCQPFADNQVWWHFEEGLAVFTWDEVGYFDCHDDRRNSFQLILEAAEVCGESAGDFNVEFRFNRCEWDVGDASGGSGGFAQEATCLFGVCPIDPTAPCTGGRCRAGVAVQSGFDAGNMTNFYEIPGSRESRTINRRLCEESNVGMPGVWRFQLRGGAVQCPTAGQECDTEMEGACAAGRISCACSGASCTTSCVPQVTPRAERCNQLDDDCDGMVDDEGEGALCASGQRCIDGACVGTCFEGGCPTGLTCTDTGCVESACVGVTCPPGERCRGGACVDACGGVTCPAPTICIGGACVDPCASVMCDECTACDDGSCAPRCDLGGSCGAGEECQASTGRCVPSGCATVSCSPGMICRAGACVDACVGATCPEGEICRAGACVAMPPEVDAGTPRPDGGVSGVDSGMPPVNMLDAGMSEPDAGRRRRPPGTGDGCCTVAAGAERGRQDGALVFGIVIGLAAITRLRRRRTMRG
ncbi:nidogen-like domain-containing protein [Sandaracinus amylolyticus]|uniref:Tryptophan synthase alpha chain n=1 Tax=Sandaracinus amylolyticus TaxID=927083 RepID=A0A0F6W989_9BACT|nr:nidogen-like domain-containing protein [Sandaracinus amylolyticus]AKF10712.1 Tryptophan synthase alpha chain [Sandaracinus amylolyticus]